MNTTIPSPSGGSGGESSHRRRPLTRTPGIVGAVGAPAGAAAITVPGALSGSSGASGAQAAVAIPAAATSAADRDDVRQQSLRVLPRVSTVRTNRGDAYRITVRGQHFQSGATSRIVIFKDGGLSGVPSWYKDATARTNGTINVNTGRLDCTAYGYPRNATLMVQERQTGLWSNKVRVSIGCGSYG